MGKEKKALRKIMKTLSGSIKRIRDLERDFPITTIAWMELRGELGSIDESLRSDLFSLAKKANEYRKRYWKVEYSIRQDIVHYMNRIGFSPSFSPQIETLANHLPRSLIIQDGRVWIFSYDTYIKDIASGVGRDWKEAPTGSDIFQRFEKKYHKDIQNLRHQADVLIREIDAFLSLLGEYLRSGNAWNVTELTPSQKRISIRSEAQLILIKRPYPLPRPPKRPRKRLFRRIKRKEIGPEDI